jgi:mono/diheme cytochrome c family protein
MFRSSSIVLAGLVTLLAACGGGTSAPAPATSPAPETAQTAPAPASSAAPSPADAPTSVQAGVYTAAQAERGQEVFGAVCGECHSAREFRGGDFLYAWGGGSVGRFVERVVKTMPEDAPGSLEMAQYIDVAAYVLSLNGFPTGQAELTSDPEVLDRILIEGAAP